MKISIIVSDQIVCVDDVCIKCTLPNVEDLKAVQFDGDQGEAEWVGKENSFVGFDFVQPFVDAHKFAVDAYELDQKTKKEEWEKVKNQYDYKRKDSYPPITDYLDGIVKGDQAQIDKYIADCLAVKAMYPKPQE